MGRRRATIIESDSEDDVALLAGNVAADDNGPKSRESRLSRASKSKASMAWDGLKPRARKASQQDDSQLENDSQPEPRRDKKKHVKSGEGDSSKKTDASVDRRYLAPDIDLETDNDGDDVDSVKKKVNSKPQKGHNDDEDLPPTTRQKSATKKIVEDSASGSSGESNYKRDDDGEEEESSEESDLEELERDKKALERQFRDEDPAWADGNDPVEDLEDDVRRFPAPATDDSDNEHDRGKQRRSSHRAGSSPQPPKKKRSKPSNPSSEESDASHVPPPPKKKKVDLEDKALKPGRHTLEGKHDAHKSRGGTSPRLDGSSRGSSSSSSSQSAGRKGVNERKAAEREWARVEKEKENGKAKVAGPRANKATPTTNPPPQNKRKRIKIDENVGWADGSDGDKVANDNAKSSKRRRAHGETDDSALSNTDSDSDGNDSGIEVVLPVKGHLKLTDQHRRVRRVVSTAIQEVLIIICTKDAFPEGTGDAASYARRALTSAAKSFNDRDMVRRLKSEEKEYWQKLASIVTQRMSNLRGKVKKATDSTPSTLFSVKKGDVGHVMYLQEGLRYIYPHDRARDTVDGTQPYAAPIFGEVIASVFFRCPRSLGYRLTPYFTSSLPDKPDEKEIPAPLLALASTGLYASIDDYRHLPYRCKDFTVNANLEAYQQNIDELSDLKTRKSAAYHKLMHGLYREIFGGGSTGVPKPPQRRFLNTADMAD